MKYRLCIRPPLQKYCAPAVNGWKSLQTAASKKAPRVLLQLQMLNVSMYDSDLLAFPGFFVSHYLYPFHTHSLLSHEAQTMDFFY